MKNVPIMLIVLLIGMESVAFNVVLQYEISRPGILCRGNRYITSFDRLQIKTSDDSKGMDFPHFEVLCYLPESKGGGVEVYRFMDKLLNNAIWFSDVSSDKVEQVEFPLGGLKLGKVSINSDDNTGHAPRLVLSVTQERDTEENRLVYSCVNEPWFHYCADAAAPVRHGAIVAGVNIDRRVWCKKCSGHVRNEYKGKVGTFYDLLILEYKVDELGDGELSEICLNVNKSIIKEGINAKQIFNLALGECSALIKNSTFQIDETDRMLTVHGKVESCFGDEWELSFQADSALQDVQLKLISIRKAIKCNAEG